MGRANRTGLYELEETPELFDLLKTYGRRLKLSMRTNTVGTVVAYNPATQKATVTVDILQIIKVFGLPDPNATAPTPPFVLTNIPVAWPRSGLGYLTFPLNPGDTGTITIMDRSIQQWLLLGAPVDPIQSATHALHDAVFEPGLHPDSAPITPPTDITAAVLHHDAKIKLGRAAALGIARLTDKTSADVSMTAWEIQVTTALVAMAAFFNAPPAPMVSAPLSVPVFPTVPPTDLGVISTASVKASSE
jgi:hypothetical protein